MIIALLTMLVELFRDFIDKSLVVVAEFVGSADAPVVLLEYLYGLRFCRHRILHDNYTRSEKFLGNTRIAFIRHPLDRFLSGFVNKCILKTSNEEEDHCFGCAESLSCFVEIFRSQIWGVYSNKQIAINEQRSCNFKEHLRDYILIYFGSGGESATKGADDMYRVFEYAGVPEHLRDEIRREISVGKSHHSTFSTVHRLKAEQELFSNQTLLKMVTELYYYDFVIFGHALPIAKRIST
ncbi:hypothetical protein RB195_014652 [Necator americanus]|uniref:Sulfotransferase family protein n=1 Tax=Necator americanus TaxID=51031 RepID=A0ABR1E0Z9_NECAM